VSSLLRIEIDGRRPSPEQVWSTVSAFGHFTAMQVRGGRTRGLALHPRRLEAANRELFDVALDRERVRGLLQQALRGVEDASVRVYVFEADGEPPIMVTVKQPGGVSTPQRLQSVRYQRPDAHIKHLATAQAYWSRLARRNGFDDALLTGGDGVVSEGAIVNIVAGLRARFDPFRRKEENRPLRSPGGGHPCPGTSREATSRRAPVS
jgi:branched-subunit amino acid aminotransferase/4-amino-4-deoxychorismate lyase